MSFDVDTIRRTLPIVMANREQLRSRFYELLDESEPQFRDLLPEESRNALRHLFDEGLTALITLYDDLDALESRLRELSAEWIISGLKPHYFSVLGETLMLALADILADAWNDKTARAWDEAFGLLINMIRAAAPADNHDHSYRT